MAKSSSIALPVHHGKPSAQHSSSDAAMLTAITRQQCELIVDEYLQTVRYRCSPECRLGMVDGIRHKTPGSALPQRFQATAPDDAHWAVIEHGLGLFDLIGTCDETRARLPRAKGGR